MYRLLLLICIPALLHAQINEVMQTDVGAWAEHVDNGKIAIPVFTIECWIKVTSTAGLIVTRDHPSSTPSDWQIWYEHTQKRIAFITGLNNFDLYFYTPANSITPNVWTHIAAVANGPAGYAKVYIDGNLIINPTYPPRTFNAPTGLAWGGYYNNANGAMFKGFIDEARYWNIERTQSQIQNARNALLPLNDRSGLVGYWMFCGNFADSSGNGHHLTPRGNPQIVQVFDLPFGLACAPPPPSINARAMLFRPIICVPPDSRDSIIWIKNTGGQPLVITEARLSGGDSTDFQILSPLIPPNVTIAPRDSAAFVIRFIPQTPGTKSTFLLVKSNASNGSTYSIPISGRKEIVAYSVSPTQFDFGILRRGQTPHRDTLTFTNSGTVPLQFTQLNFTPGTGFRILTPFPIDVPVGGRAICIIEFDASESGVYKSIMQLRVAPCNELIYVPVIATLIAELNFPTLMCTSEIPRDTTIRFYNYTDSPLVVSRLSISGANASDYSIIFPQLPPSAAIPVNDFITIVVRFTPRQSGNSSAQLGIEFASGNPRSVTIQLSGKYDRFALSLASPLIDFGQNFPSQLPREKSVSLTNAGDVTFGITIEDFSIGTGFKLLTPFPVSLQSNQSSTIRVQFDSTVNGVYQSILRLRSTVCDTVLEIPVIGNIVSPLPFAKLICAAAERETSIVVHNFTGRILRFTLAEFTGSGRDDFELLFPPGIPPQLDVPAGDSVRLWIRFRPKTNGVKNAMLELSYQSIVNGVLQIPLAGERSGSIYSIAPSLVDFGTQTTATLPMRKGIVIRNTGNEAVVIQTFTISTKDTFTVLTPLPRSIAAGAIDTIWIQFQPASDGIFSASAIIFTLPCADSITIALRGERKNAALISVTPLAFGVIACSNEQSRDSLVMLRNIGTDTLAIFSATITGADAASFSLLSPPSIPPSLRLAPGDSLAVRVRFAPSHAGQHSASLNLVSNSMTNSSAVIDLSGYRMSTTLSVDATVIDFGSNSAGDLPKELRLLVTNTGTVDRVVTSIVFFPPDGFQCMTPLPMTIKAGSAQSIIVRFATQVDGLFASRMSISLSPCDTTLLIDVRGARSDKPYIVHNQPPIFSLLCANDILRDTTVVIRNSGSAMLRIDRARVTSGDSTEFILLSPSSFPITVAPHDSAVFRVRFAPTGFGTRTSALIIESNAINDSLLRIALVGRKERVALRASLREIDLGILCPNETRDSSFTVRNFGTIISTASVESDPPITASPFSFAVDTTQSQRIDFRFNGIAQEGPFNGMIRIRDRCDAIDTVRVKALIVLPRLSVDPITVSTGGVLIPVDGSGQIRNSGARRVTITRLQCTDARFQIISPPLPATLEIGESITVTVRYTPTDTASVQTALRVDANPCSIVEQAVVRVLVNADRTIAVTSASHGTLRCELFRDTTVTVRNTGNTPLHISSATIAGPHASDFSLAAPVSIPPICTIPASGVLMMRVRFEPRGTGLRTATLEIASDASNAPVLSIPLTGRKEDTRIVFSDSVIDLGVLCPSHTTSRTVALTNVGSLAQTISCRIAAPFVVSRSSFSLAPRATDSVVVTFAGETTAGLYRETLFFIDECFVEHRIPIVASVIAPSLSGQAVSYRTIVDSTVVASVRLINPSSTVVTITQWSTDDSRFTVIEPSLPQILPPRGELFVEVSFHSSVSDTIDRALIVEAFPCNVQARIPLHGEAVEPSATVMFETVTAGVDERLGIPMRLLHAKYIEQSGAVSFLTRVRFNRTLLLPTGVRTNSTTAIARIVANTTNASDRILELEVNDIAPPAEGVIVYLDCITGLGNAERTPLKIESFSWTRGRVRTTTIDGEFISTGICREGGARLLAIPPTITVKQSYPNPTTADAGTIFVFSVSGLETSGQTKMPISIRLYDILGRPARSVFDDIIGAGEHVMKIDCAGLSEGSYIVQMHSPVGDFSRLLTIVKR